MALHATSPRNSIPADPTWLNNLFVVWSVFPSRSGNEIGIVRCPSGFGLVQDCYDLLLAEPAFPHRRSTFFVTDLP